MKKLLIALLLSAFGTGSVFCMGIHHFTDPQLKELAKLINKEQASVLLKDVKTKDKEILKNAETIMEDMEEFTDTHKIKELAQKLNFADLNVAEVRKINSALGLLVIAIDTLETALKEAEASAKGEEEKEAPAPFGGLSSSSSSKK